MAFGKIKQTRFNVEAFYHTVTKVNIDLSRVPDPILDENNQIIGYKGGSKSFVTLASYKDKDSYLIIKKNLMLLPMNLTVTLWPVFRTQIILGMQAFRNILGSIQ